MVYFHCIGAPVGTLRAAPRVPCYFCHCAFVSFGFCFKSSSWTDSSSQIPSRARIDSIPFRVKASPNPTQIDSSLSLRVSLSRYCWPNVSSALGVEVRRVRKERLRRTKSRGRLANRFPNGFLGFLSFQALSDAENYQFSECLTY